MRAAISPQVLKKAERWVILLIGLTVAVTLAVTLIASGRSFVSNVAHIPWGTVCLLLIATLAENLLRFWRYPVAAAALGLRVPPLRMLYYYTVGYALIPTPGKLGTAIRLWLLRQYHGLPYRRTAPLLVMDFISDAIAIFALASLALLVTGDSRLTTLGLLLGAALALGVGGTLLAPRLLGVCLKLLYRFSGRRKPRLFARLLRLIATTSRVLGGRVLLSATLLSFVGWALVGIAIGHLVTGFGQIPLSAAEGTLCLTLSNIGGFVSMMPAGVGGAEVTMAGLFTLFNVPLGLAVLATAIVRLIVLWLSVLAGLALLPFALRRAPRQRGRTVDILA